MVLLPILSVPKPRQDDRPEVTPEKLDELARRYLANESVYRLAREINRTDEWLRLRFRRRNIPIRGYAEARRIRKDRERAAKRVAA
ncbi:hypothetical protein ACGF0D_07570 [Kitasatospora sp. NPDC048298]|uniref:hypothetical protein n=1 Tax=Kitasatospora sp. NPDC048298 TaxID=3364049 RepID=UPI0037165728